ncbi:MAG: hypothetical protein ABI615_03655 [Chthoniobacterales bacterium]
MNILYGIIFLAASLPLMAQLTPPLTAADLINRSPVIAIISIPHAPTARINDASLDLEIFKQRTKASCLQKIKGDLPSAFLIENEKDSVLTAGTHLAFLRLINDNRYILSTPVSLRRIERDDVYWFEGFSPLEGVVKEIQTTMSKEGREYPHTQ